MTAPSTRDQVAQAIDEARAERARRSRVPILGQPFDRDHQALRAAYVAALVERAAASAEEALADFEAGCDPSGWVGQLVSDAQRANLELLVAALDVRCRRCARGTHR